MSSANKNPEATVKFEAFDGLGNKVDQREYYGRYEPAIAFLEFMMDVKRMYPKVTRFTAEVAYALLVVIGLNFLSSRAEAHRGSYGQVGFSRIEWCHRGFCGVAIPLYRGPIAGSTSAFDHPQKPIQPILRCGYRFRPLAIDDTRLTYAYSCDILYGQ